MVAMLADRRSISRLKSLTIILATDAERPFSEDIDLSWQRVAVRFSTSRLRCVKAAFRLESDSLGFTNFCILSWWRQAYSAIRSESSLSFLPLWIPDDHLIWRALSRQTTMPWSTGQWHRGWSYRPVVSQQNSHCPLLTPWQHMRRALT